MESDSEGRHDSLKSDLKATKGTTSIPEWDLWLAKKGLVELSGLPRVPAVSEIPEDPELPAVAPQITPPPTYRDLIIVYNATGEKIKLIPSSKGKNDWRVKDFTGECSSCPFYISQIPSYLSGVPGLTPPPDAVGICSYGMKVRGRGVHLHKYLVKNEKHPREECTIPSKERDERLAEKKAAGNFFV